MSPSSSFVISFECKDKTVNIGWKSKVDQLVHSAQPQVQPVKEILTITNTNILTKQKVLSFLRIWHALILIIYYISPPSVVL